MQTHCPRCHQLLSADAPEGLCPSCLLQAAFGGSGGKGGAEGEEGADNPEFIDIGDAAEVGRLLPQFEILALLGRGGMGVVYKARQLQLDRVVALKILPPLEAMSADFVTRFSREAQALARLNHPHIVHVYDFGETNGLYFIAMEFVDGTTLREVFESRKFTPAEALAMVPPICEALEYAHQKGLVHRDIKPENLLIDSNGQVKIADFGLAKLLHREPLDLSLTRSGVSLGTVRYMAPEQMDNPEAVDHRADIYSLGVVIYEMLTGEVPRGHFELPSRRAPVDARLDPIVLQALAHDVKRRYQHASQVGVDVENVRRQAASTLPLDHRVAAVFGVGVRWYQRRAAWSQWLIRSGLLVTEIILLLFSMSITVGSTALQVEDGVWSITAMPTLSMGGPSPWLTASFGDGKGIFFHLSSSMWMLLGAIALSVLLEWLKRIDPEYATLGKRVQRRWAAFVWSVLGIGYLVLFFAMVRLAHQSLVNARILVAESNAAEAAKKAGGIGEKAH